MIIPEYNDIACFQFFLCRGIIRRAGEGEAFIAQWFQFPAQFVNASSVAILFSPDYSFRKPWKDCNRDTRLCPAPNYLLLKISQLRKRSLLLFSSRHLHFWDNNIPSIILSQTLLRHKNPNVTVSEPFKKGLFKLITSYTFYLVDIELLDFVK